MPEQNHNDTAVVFYVPPASGIGDHGRFIINGINSFIMFRHFEDRGKTPELSGFSLMAPGSNSIHSARLKQTMCDTLLKQFARVEIVFTEGTAERERPLMIMAQNIPGTNGRVTVAVADSPEAYIASKTASKDTKNPPKTDWISAICKSSGQASQLR